jgi:hypothetical protein
MDVKKVRYMKHKAAGNSVYLDTEVIWRRAMTTTRGDQANGRESDAENGYQIIADEFDGFLANPAALKRGGVATQAARNQKWGTLLDRMAQSEINHFWRAEIAALVQLSQTLPRATHSRRRHSTHAP